MAEHPWRLRAALPDDAGALADVVIAATEARRPFGSAEQRHRWRDAFVGWTRETIEGTDELSVVLDERGAIVGRLRVVRTDDRIELAGVQLLPAAQGRGIGGALVGSLQREAAERGVPLDLGVEKDNPRARALYERLGFRRTGDTDEEHLLRWTREAPAADAD